MRAIAVILAFVAGAAIGAVACAVIESVRANQREVQLLSDVHDPLRQILDDIEETYDRGDSDLAEWKTRLLRERWAAYLNGGHTPEQFVGKVTQLEDWRHGTGVCSVHERKMNTVQVNGLAGEVNFRPEYFEARETLFPNAGIEYGPELYSPGIGLIYVCPDCEAARQSWKAPTRP